jgi:hypothetical protein
MKLIIDITEAHIFEAKRLRRVAIERVGINNTPKLASYCLEVGLEAAIKEYKIEPRVRVLANGNRIRIWPYRLSLEESIKQAKCLKWGMTDQLMAGLEEELPTVITLALPEEYTVTHGLPTFPLNKQHGRVCTGNVERN